MNQTILLYFWNICQTGNLCLVDIVLYYIFNEQLTKNLYKTTTNKLVMQLECQLF